MTATSASIERAFSGSMYICSDREQESVSHLTHTRSLEDESLKATDCTKIGTTKNKEKKHYIHLEHKIKQKETALANTTN